MAKKPKALRDVSRSLEEAVSALEEIERRAMYENPPQLSFEQRIIAAVRALDNGDPIKDWLSSEDIEQAIKVLGDVYTVTGVTMPVDWV